MKKITDILTSVVAYFIVFIGVFIILYGSWLILISVLRIVVPILVESHSITVSALKHFFNILKGVF